MSAEQGNGDARLQWYRDAKFGLFLHWGAYSVAGVEASWSIMAPEISEAAFQNRTRITETEYVALPKRFNPVDFRPADWVRAAQDAGMRYIVITAKHHDGFCMFDAPGTDYKITRTPYGRDVCLELARACAEAGMRLGFYYSPPDMHHPGYRNVNRPVARNWLGEPTRPGWAGYLDYMESHVRKLLTDYGPVSVLWFDGLVNHPKYDPPRFHALVHEMSPDTLINDRLGNGFDFITPEQFIPKNGIPVHTGAAPSGNDPGGDGFMRIVLFLFKVPGIGSLLRNFMRGYGSGVTQLTSVPQEPYPSPERFQPWETCMTVGRSWAYNPRETDWKVPGQLVRNLVDVVSGGGNYLLDVGPTDRGTLPPEALQRLAYVGEWMGRNRESIYGTTYTPLRGLPWGRATRKGDRVYLHVHQWPSDGRLEIDPFPGAVKAVSTLSGDPLAFSLSGRKLSAILPPRAPDPDVSVLAVDLAEEGPEWKEYSPAAYRERFLKRYVRTQAVTAAWVNSLINGALAFSSFAGRPHVAFVDLAFDVLITTVIISFLTSWLVVGSTRTKIGQGEIAVKPGPRLARPLNAALVGLLISLVCAAVAGGLVIDGAMLAVSPGGLAGWVYAIVKTVYTGLVGAVSVVMAIRVSIRRRGG